MRNSRLKKSLAWALYQRDQLRNAQCLHALNRAEYDAIRKVGLANPVCVIPNGVHVPELDSRQIRRAGRRAFLFLGRLHPKKNVHSLIAAWAHLYANTESARSWSLLIAGDGPPEYVDELRRLASQLATDARPTFLGHVSGNEKTALLNEGPIMILPSHSEGLPMAVLESFSFGNAVLLSRDSNFPEAVQSGAALEIGTGVDDIAAGLRTAIDLPEERLLAMGAKGRELVMARYSWDRVASDFACVYQWLHDKTARPHCLVD
jgi:poly(glycerol-phosphate) alpha-glucosyltransferase